jgi:hypothetical protein
MARLDLSLEIPDGKFCSSKSMLGCMYGEMNNGIHYCYLFHESARMEHVVTTELGSSRNQRLVFKCSECMKLMKDSNKKFEINDTGDVW